MATTTALPYIPISAPRFGPAEEASVLEVLRSGMIAQGPKVARFEELCSSMAGAAHAIAVTNGTIALEAALEVSGIGPGDEVITSPFTFAATLNAILGRGASARFAEIGDDFNVVPQSIESLINARTRAIMPVHLYGLMADMEAISVIAGRHGLHLIEDSAQAHGARIGQRRAGSYGLGCFSFYATKNVTSAEGGVITTSDDHVAARLRILRNQGMQSRYDYVMIGHNWRLTDLCAAVAIPQMERLDELIAARNRNARTLSQRLSGVPGLLTPSIPAGRSHVWHQYTVLLPEGIGRKRIISALAKRGIGAGAYYPELVWNHPPYRENPRVIIDDTPRAAIIAQRCLSLPVRPDLSDGEVVRVADSLISAIADQSP